MQASTYLSFAGDCEEAFAFYARCFDGQPGTFYRYAGTELASDVPSEWSNKIMHASITLGGHLLMGGDVPPERYEQPKGFSLSLQLTDPEQAERVFKELADGGRVVQPLEQTFWAARFGSVIDRFGIPWLINCG